MTTKAPSTLILIMEKQHASWDLMGITSPAVDLVHRAPWATLTVRGRAWNGPTETTFSEPDSQPLGVWG